MTTERCVRSAASVSSIQPQPSRSPLRAPRMFRIVLLLALMSLALQVAQANTNPVIRENLLPGTTEWQLELGTRRLHDGTGDQ